MKTTWKVIIEIKIAPFSALFLLWFIPYLPDNSSYLVLSSQG
ncbi:putative membrane protein [Vibrio cholerae HE-25]|nr:putative membrane protein [Vibrio cholerae HE-25]